MQAPEKKFINVEEVIASKNKNLLRVMPGFLLRYIKRIIHQEEINEFIQKHGNKTSFDFVDAILEEFGVEIEYEGVENMPSSGGCIVASNHPLGGIDAMALIQVIEQKRTDIKFVVNDILLQLKNLESLFIGVNKHGKNSLEKFAAMDKLYASGVAMLIFPAGLVSRKQKAEVIKDLEWKKSFVKQARKNKHDIIPVYIEGRNSNFFYNLSRFRSRIGIKANVEMFYLMDEMYHQKGKTIKIIFGKPLSYEIFTGEKTDYEWAQLVKEHVYTLGRGGKSPLAVYGSHH